MTLCHPKIPLFFHHNLNSYRCMIKKPDLRKREIKFPKIKKKKNSDIDMISSYNCLFQRPSLLFTPPRREDTSLSVTSNVPIAQLISFTP